MATYSVLHCNKRCQICVNFTQFCHSSLNSQVALISSTVLQYDYKFHDYLAIPAVYDVPVAAGFVYTVLSWQQCLPGFVAVLLCRKISAANNRLIKFLKFQDPLDTKIGHFKDGLPSQSLSKVMKKLNPTTKAHMHQLTDRCYDTK